MSNVAIRVEGLHKQYRLGGAQQRYKTLRDSIANAALRPFRRWRNKDHQDPVDTSLFWALKDVSFEIKAGEVVGVIGRNGAGKSTLLKVLSRITEPTSGYAEIHGRVGSLLEVGTGFHPELSGRENIYLNGAILGMKRTEVERKFDEIVSFAEVEQFVDTPVKFYSSGMYLRLAFAVAAHLEPEILLVDEVLAVGDRRFQDKCLGKMGEVAQHGRTVLLVSHNMAAIAAICTECLYLDGGSICLQGNVSDVVGAYSSGAQNGRSSGSLVQVERLNCGQATLVSPSDLKWDVGSTQTFNFAVRWPFGTTSAMVKLVVTNGAGQEIMMIPSQIKLEPCDTEEVNFVSVELPSVWLSPGVYSVHMRFFPNGIGVSSKFVTEFYNFDICSKDFRSGAASSVLDPPVKWSTRRQSQAVQATKS